MAKFVGIDIQPGCVRAVRLRSSLRRLTLEAAREVAFRDDAQMPEEALRTCVMSLVGQGETVAVALDGTAAFVRRFDLPPTAAKRLTEIVPFELEALIPVDVDSVVHDFSLLKRKRADGYLGVLCAAAHQNRVRAQIDLVRGALGMEPERVACGSLPLANLMQLCPALRVPEPVAIVNIGHERTDIVILLDGEVTFARTLAVGLSAALADAVRIGIGDSVTPSGGEQQLLAELRRSFTAWSVKEPRGVQKVVVFGVEGAEEQFCSFLTEKLAIPVDAAPPLTLEVAPELRERLPRFVKAISTALSLSGASRDLNLRQGELGFQRGYGFLRERIPTLVGIGLAIIISFLFALWAEMRVLEGDKEALVAELEMVSERVFGTGTGDPSQVAELLRQSRLPPPADPKPVMDAFDVILELTKAVPATMVHDVQEFDLERGHVKITGVVGTAGEAQAIADTLQKHRCFNDVKISRITKEINGDRQKYILDFEMKCPDAANKKGRKKSANRSGEGKP